MTAGAETAPERTNVVVLCTDAKFFLPSAFLIEQLAADPAGDRYDIVLVHQGAPEADLRRLAERAARPVGIIPFHADSAGLPGAPPAEHVSRATYIRLHLHELLPPHYRRILYLGSDIFVERHEIVRLFDLDLGEAAFAASQDGLYAELLCPEAMPDLPYLRRDRDATVAYQEGLGLTPGDPYLNSGVMLIDRARWTALAIPERALTFALRHPERCMIADQSAINAVARGQWVQLSPQWNFQGTHMLAGLENAIRPIVWHFAGPYKPWNTEAWGTRFTRAYHDWRAAAGWQGAFPAGPALPADPPPGWLRRLRDRLFGRAMREGGGKASATYGATVIGAKRRAAFRHAVLAILTFGRFVDLDPAARRSLLKAVADVR